MTDWEDLRDYEGWYQINREGQIRNIKKRPQISIGRILKPSIIKDGYLQIHLRKDETIKQYLIHRLLAIQFIPNPDNKREIDHIDRNPTNNSICNLRWATRSENMNNTSRNLNMNHEEREIHRKTQNKIKTAKYRAFKNGWEELCRINI